MRKNTSRAQAPGLRADWQPNRAMRRHDRRGSELAYMRLMTAWQIAARLMGYVPPKENDADAAA